MDTGYLSPYGSIPRVIYVDNKVLFPISWLQKQGYCEYQIYLENVKGIKAKPSKAMEVGKEVHESLYQQFAQKAVPATMEQIITESRTAAVLSREFKVVDVSHGLYGYIDEVWFTPDRFIVIDDKPGISLFTSNIHQVYGHCLAFKGISQPDPSRKLIAALRERGTDNFFWQAPFNREAEEEITAVVKHMHALLSGKEQFIRTDNLNKCKACRLNRVCMDKTTEL